MKMKISKALRTEFYDFFCPLSCLAQTKGEMRIQEKLIVLEQFQKLTKPSSAPVKVHG